MIKQGSKSIIARMIGNKVVKSTYKGALLVYQAFKEYIVKGVFPLKLEKSSGKDLTNYKIEGNSVQEGTPTTENPIEIESVGDKTSNFADLSKAVAMTTTPHVKFDYNNIAGSLILTSTPTAYDYVAIYPKDVGLKFEEGKTYYFGADVTVNGKTTTDKYTAVGYRIKYSGNSMSGIYVNKNGVYHVSDTFTYTGQTDIYLALFFNYGSQEPTQVRFDNIYWGEVDEFEPCGYKIPVKTSGKNLIPNIFTSETKNGITLDVNDDGTLHVYGKATADTIFNPRIYNLPPNTYFLSGCPSGGSNSTYRLLAYFVNPKYNLIEYGEGNGYTLSDTTDVIIEVKVYNGTTVDLIYKPMLEVGTVGTEYEPYQEPVTTNIYLNEPLRKISYRDEIYQDVLNYKDKKVVRNICSEFITSIFNKSSTVGTYGIFLSEISNKPKMQNDYAGLCISSKFVMHTVNGFIGSYVDLTENGGHIQTYITSGGLNRVAYSFNDSSIKTVEQGQEKIGDGFEVCYLLATPIEETIELPSIPTLEGTTILDSDVTVKPIYVEVEYTGKP